MDPNKTLSEIRNFYKNGNEEDFSELVELIEALDEWIASGGFLPEVWGKSRSSEVRW